MRIFPFFGNKATEERDTSIKSTLNIIQLAGNMFGGSSSQPVNEATALRLSAVWACLRVLSESFATLPVNVFTSTNVGKEMVSDHPTARVLKRTPNQWMTSFVFRQMAMAHVVLRGNFYALIIRNSAMQVEELLPIFGNVEIVKEKGQYFYKFEMDDESYITNADNILHIKGFTTDGLQGKSVLEAHRETLGLGLSAQKASKDFYDNGSKLEGYIQLPEKLNADTIAKLRESWTKTYGGYSKNKTAILDNGAEYKTINLSPEDAKYLETRKYQKEEIASIFRVPPHMIGIMDRATWNNVEYMSMEFAKYTMLPYCVNWEEEINRKLFKQSEQDSGYYAKFNIDSIIRADIKTRYEAYVHAIQNGIKSINEVRELEDMNPISGGEAHYMQLNMTTIDKLGQDEPE